MSKLFDAPRITQTDEAQTAKDISVVMVDNKAPAESINIDDLKGRVCYFSLTGNLSLDAFLRINFSQISKDKKDEKLKIAVTDRLYFALLMFDRVVIHCSDPLRSPVVLNILEENKAFIESGRIVFLTSNSIRDYQKDYKEYIERKIREYEDGYYSLGEAESLKAKHIDNAYYDRVITLLELSPFMIRKSQKSDNGFRRLVTKDLADAHNDIVDSSSDNSTILFMNLSLKQLLNAQSYRTGDRNKSNSGRGTMIFPNESVSKIIDDITNMLDQNAVISRTAIADFLRQQVTSSGRLSHKQKEILDVITMRMDVLYCLMNCGDQMLLEFHPYYEQKSIYRLDCFLALLKHISGGKDIELDLIFTKSIIESDALDTLRMYYLSIMADTHECMRTLVNSVETRILYKTYGQDIFNKRLLQTDSFFEKSDHLQIIKRKLLEEDHVNN